MSVLNETPEDRFSRDVTHLNDVGDNADFRTSLILKQGLPATQLLESRESKNTASSIVH